MRLLPVSPTSRSKQTTDRSRNARFFSRDLGFIKRASAVLLRSVHRRRLSRRLVSFAIILNLFIWPAPGITLKSFEPASALASTVSSTVIGEVGLAFSELRAAPVVFVPLGPILLPLPVFPLWPLQSSRVASDLTMAERIARVSSITVSPQKHVGYIGDSVTFVAMGADAEGQPAHGAKFTWESSNEDKLTIDEAGRATLLGPGLVRVTARAGAIEKAASVLIRPLRRPMQTDSEWKDDQDSLVGEGQSTGDKSVGVLASMLDRLMPTAHAQFNPWGDNPKAAQTIGTPPYAALEETPLGPVMPQTNFELPLPLVSLGGRGLATSLMAYYNSNVWGAYFDPARNGTVFAFDPIQSWPSPGFTLGFARITFYNGYYDPGAGDMMYTYMLVDPNGTRHNLGVGSSAGSNTLKTTDGSHITYVGNVMGGTLYSNDGTKSTIGKVHNRLLTTQITDTNGNYIQIAYKWETNFAPMAINYIVDTLGRVIQFNYGQWPAPSSTSLSSISTPAGTVTFNYQAVTMDYNFATAVAVENAPASFSAVSSIGIPARPTYSFSYSGYGMIYNISAASQGGTATVTYDYPLGGEELYGGVTFTQRTESPNAVYSYSSSGEITRPDGTILALSRTVRRLKNNSGQTLSKTEYTFTTDPGGSTVVQSVTATDETAQQTKVDFDYDQYGNVVNKREYGFKISGLWQARRRTHYDYVNWEPYLSAYIRNRVREVDVFDALQNTNDADDVLIGKSAYGYDSPLTGMEGYGGTANPPGHLSSYGTGFTTRGNLTNVVSYTDVGTGAYVTHSNQTDIFGGVTLAQVACCDQKSFTMTEATYWTKPSQTTSGNMSGTYLTSSAGYNFNTLTEANATDPDGQVTTYSYNSWGNPTGFTSPTGATGSTAYNAWGERSSSSVTYNDGGTNKTLTQTAVYDAWGQMTSSVDANGAQTNFTYNNMGRMITRTNPFAQGGTPGPVTTYAYDLLGRNTVVTLPGGNTVQTSYTNSAIVTVTDQVNRKIKRETDGLGRLIKVTEQDVSTGALTQETTYTYDLADRLIGVNQGNQTRAFKYDSEGRLLFERIPEQTATINDGTGVFWTSKYTYTDWGAVATKQDPRGVITTYGYDTLHRLISVSYNTVSGVTTAPAVSYNYDNTVGSATKGLLLSLTVGSGYSETYSYNVGYGNGGNGGNKLSLASVNRVMDGLTYVTSYQYNAANQLTQMIYPAAARTLNIAHDSRGRVNSLADQYRTYVNNFTYNGAGQVTGLSLGNVANESYGYDANRMQLTSQTATQVGGAANGLMNLTYGYQASAGQMGAGTTAGNAGQLMSISGTIGGLTESAAYTYDDVGRLVTSNQTSNLSSAQRRFAYDRWGNRTGMWDAVSGGNQIQSIALQQSGGAPTNRITSVTSGSTVNYSYDAAGNVTNDGVHAYAYDSENRIVSVDGGSTASYAYDNQNRRYKKTVGSTATHYVWEGPQVLAEHDASTGGVIYNYVYSGSRLVARMGSGVINWFASDRLSNRLVLDASGNVVGRQGHLPFGEDFGESGTQEKHHFTTYDRDSESGTDYAMNRQYPQSVGRFSRVDPVGGFIRNPQSLNRYSYVVNDPENSVDPDGLLLRCPPGTHPEMGSNGIATGKCVSDGPSAGLPGSGPNTGPGSRNPPLKPPTSDPAPPEDPLSGLNPCERKLALLDTSVLHFPGLKKSRKIAEKWEADNGGPQDDNWVNAVKHCVWSCEMTQRMSFEAAVKWGTAHECDENGKQLSEGPDAKKAASSRMDLHNNEAGRFYGEKFPNQDCLTSCRSDTYGRLQSSP
jgi:RHS repeat-associated protein